MKTSPSPHEARALALLGYFEPLAAFRQLIAANDALIRSADLDCGRELVAARTAAHTVIVADWAERQRAAFGYSRPFAVVALGGTGRQEVTPCSDLDIAFLVDDEIEGNAFLLELQRQTVHTAEFERAHGFHITPMPFGFDDAPLRAAKDLNSFLDLCPLYDPAGLADAFRERIRKTYDPFEHFLYAREFWKERLVQAPAFERLDRLDIKNDVLRIFQGGVWTLGGQRYVHSHEIYGSQLDRRDLEAYYFLLRIRSWVHLRRPAGGRPGPTGNHPEDLFGFDDFASFGDMLGPAASEPERFDFANEVRARLLAARRRVFSFARGVIERELRQGRRVSPTSSIVYGAGGLHHAPLPDAPSPQDRSRAALALLLASQRYGVPIDPSELQTTFCNAGDWLERVPEVAALFYDTRGSLADTFAFLNQIDGAEERLFPGRAQFEVSFDQRVLADRQELRGALELRKLRAFEEFAAQAAQIGPEKLRSLQLDSSPEVSAAFLDTNHLAAVKLALKTKRLSVTPDDEATRADASRSLFERHSSGFSGIPLAEYYQRFAAECGFNAETIAATEFLVANRRAFRTRAEEGQTDDEQVEAFRVLCGTEQRLHALYVFNCADRLGWATEQSHAARWFSVRELDVKTRRAFLEMAIDPEAELRGAGYAPEDLRILCDLGEAFYGGLYRAHANRFGADLVRLAQSEEAVPTPKAALLHDGASLILGVAARDFRGLAACISGALWKERIGLHQAHFFSAMNYGLALDFFHLARGAQAIPDHLPRIVQEAVRAQLHIAPSDETGLPRLNHAVDLQQSHPGKYRLRCEAEGDTGSLIYALCLKLLLHLSADIYGLSASATRAGSLIIIHHSLPEWTSLEAARGIVRERF